MRMGPRSVYSMLEESVAANGDVAALHQPGGGKYESYTWPQYRDAVREIAVGLGDHRHPVHFSGDTHSNWEVLESIAKLVQCA